MFPRKPRNMSDIFKVKNEVRNSTFGKKNKRRGHFCMYNFLTTGSNLSDSTLLVLIGQLLPYCGHFASCKNQMKLAQRQSQKVAAFTRPILRFSGSN